MKISKGTKANFNMMERAAADGALCIMDAYDKQLKKSVVLVCATQKSAGLFEFVPFAVMIDGNPYERYAPPAHSGTGYEGVKT